MCYLNNETILLSLSEFLPIKDLQKTCKALNVDKITELKMFKRACLAQLSLTDTEKVSILNTSQLPPLTLNAGLFLKVYKPNLLKRMIMQNELLDPRTKVQLLTYRYPILFNWFIDTFIENKPLICKIGNRLKYIFNVVNNENMRQLKIDDFLFMCVGDRALRCYDITSNEVVAFAISDTLYYLNEKIVPYFQHSLMFETIYSIYKHGEANTIERLGYDS